MGASGERPGRPGTSPAAVTCSEVMMWYRRGEPVITMICSEEYDKEKVCRERIDKENKVKIDTYDLEIIKRL